MLGVGDFYYELGVQAVEVCIAIRPQNGGIMMLSELHQRWNLLPWFIFIYYLVVCLHSTIALLAIAVFICTA